MHPTDYDVDLLRIFRNNYYKLLNAQLLFALDIFLLWSIIFNITIGHVIFELLYMPIRKLLK